MEENKSVLPRITTHNVFFQPRSLTCVTLFRTAFGIVWILDGSMKFLWLQPSDVVKLIHHAPAHTPQEAHCYPSSRERSKRYHNRSITDKVGGHLEEYRVR